MRRWTVLDGARQGDEETAGVWWCEVFIAGNLPVFGGVRQYDEELASVRQPDVLIVRSWPVYGGVS